MATTDNKENCDFCKRSVDEVRTFRNCPHEICFFCLFERIFSHHLADLQGQKAIKVTCKCNVSDMELKLSEVLKVLNKKRKIDLNRVIEGGFENIEDTVEGCECHENKDDSKQLFSDYFCVDCIKWVCSKCNEDTTKPHYRHRVLRSRHLLNYIKDNVKNIFLKNTSYEFFEKRWQNLSNQFQKVVEVSFNATLKKLDNLIALVKNLKKDFIKNYEAQIRNQVKTFKIIKLYYMNYYTDKKAELAKINVENNDIFKLKYLANISYEFMDFNLSYPKEFDEIIDKMHKDIENIKPSEMKLIDSKYVFEKRKKGYAYEKHSIINAHSKYISSVVLLNNQIITGSTDYFIKIWDNEEGKYKNKQVLKSKQITCLIALKNGKILAASKTSSDILVHELNEKKEYYCSQSLSSHDNIVTSMIELLDGKIVSGSADGKIILWEENQKLKQYMIKQTIQKRNPIIMLINLHDYKIADTRGDCTCFDVMSAETELNDGKIMVKEFNDFCCMEKLPGKIICMCDLNNGYFAYGGTDINKKTNNIYFWRELEDRYINGQTILNAHDSDINSLIILRDGRLASASKDRTIKIWTIKLPIIDTNVEYVLEQTLNDYSHGLYKLIQLKDDRIVASTSENNLVFWRNTDGII